MVNPFLGSDFGHGQMASPAGGKVRWDDLALFFFVVFFGGGSMSSSENPHIQDVRVAPCLTI